jgi:hypothetical protein
MLHKMTHQMGMFLNVLSDGCVLVSKRLIRQAGIYIFMSVASHTFISMWHNCQFELVLSRRPKTYVFERSSSKFVCARTRERCAESATRSTKHPPNNGHRPWTHGSQGAAAGVAGRTASFRRTRRLAGSTCPTRPAQQKTRV